MLVAPFPAPPANQVRALPDCHGSADALLLAALAQREAAARRTLAIVTAGAPDAQRLADEMRWFASGLRVLLLPDWETLPYDAFSPHQDLISERLSTLYALQRGECDALLVPAGTALHRLAPPEFLASHTFFFHKGQQLDEARLRSQLTLAGYEHVSQVVHPGEYCVRGGLIDLYPMGSALPYRLDLFGDEIESIRTFDPDSQRSLYPIEQVRLLPGREFPMDEAARTAFRSRWRERFEGDPSRSTLYRDVGNGIAPAGIEYWLPLFHERTATLFDYLPAGAIVVSHGDVDAAARRFADEAGQRFRFLSHDRERPLLRPDELFIDGERFFVEARRFGRWAIARVGENARPRDDRAPTAAGDRVAFTAALPDVAVNRRADNPVERLASFLQGSPSRTLVVAESPGRRETLFQLLADHGLSLPAVDDWPGFAAADAPAALTIGPLHDGFTLPGAGIAVITEAELFVGTVRRTRRGLRESQTDIDSIIRDLSELKVGDPVVHAQHGIGRYLGLDTMDLGDGPTEFLHLTYANQATLYVPVSQLHVIGRYSGASLEDAPLHQLGSDQWEKARTRAARRARDAAAELLNLYARRAARTGHAFGFAAHDYEAFTDGFAFEETPDQLAAIHAVIQDMVAGKPMDRLVCGDVGFGKTEVALRAAFVAVQGGRQVAVLVPTTL
ncbi:MAG: transcription-repair coupling factor, partial [Burkholderiales bacterium]